MRQKRSVECSVRCSVRPVDAYGMVGSQKRFGTFDLRIGFVRSEEGALTAVAPMCYVEPPTRAPSRLSPSEAPLRVMIAAREIEPPGST